MILRLGVTFNRLVKYIENELSDTFFKYRENAFPPAMDKFERWKSLGLIEASSEWQAIRDLDHELSITGIEYSETTTKNLNILVSLAPKLSLIIANFEKLYIRN